MVSFPKEIAAIKIVERFARAASGNARVASVSKIYIRFLCAVDFLDDSV